MTPFSALDPRPPQPRILGRRLLLGAAFAAPLLPLGLRSVRAEEGVLRIGYQKNGSLVILKQQRRLESLFAARRITVRWLEFQSGPLLLEAMGAGSVDFGATGDTPPIFAQAAGVDLTYVAAQPVTGKSMAILVHASGPIARVADLKGRRIAFTKGSAAHYDTVRTLATAGLTLADVRPVYLLPADAGAAFRAGAIDAWTIWDPFYAIAEREPGARVLVTGEVAPTNSFLLADRGFAARDPDTIVALVGAINEAGQWAEAHPDQLARILAEVTGVDPDAERVAAARGRYRAAFITDEVVRRQQEEADTFFDLRLIPAKIAVRDAVWLPPADTAIAGAKP